MNHVLHEIQMPTLEGTISRAKQANHIGTLCGHLVICANTAEPIEVPFRLWARIMCYMGGPDLPWERAIMVDRGAHLKV